jgi:hypothetical protein
MGFIVVTKIKEGDKHVQSDSEEAFWLRWNSKNHPDFHVRLKHFTTEEEATKYALEKTPEVTPIAKNGMTPEQMEAEIEKRVAAKLAAAAEGDTDLRSVVSKDKTPAQAKVSEVKGNQSKK